MKFTIAAAATCLVPTLALAQLTPAWTYVAGRITMGSPRIADINGDGAKDVVFGTMGPVGDPYNSGWVGAFDLSGALLPGFPIEISHPIVGPVAIGDLNDDGTIEIVATSWQFLWAWNHDGTIVPGFPISTGVSSGIPPALADLDGNGRLDIIVAQGNLLYVYDHTGAVRPGWPITSARNFQAPAVGDITGDGQLEIVAGTWAPQFPDQVPHELHVVRADGTPLPGFPLNNLGSIRGPVALGDVTDDGEIEIVARSGDQVFVWNHQGAVLPGWPVATGGPTRNSATAIGDITGDGKLEIVLGGYDVYAYNSLGQQLPGWPVASGSSGNIRSSPVIVDLDPEPGLEVLVKITDNMLGFTATGSSLSWSPYFLSDLNQSTTFSPSPTVADANGDGMAELAVISAAGEIHFFNPGVPFDPALAPWPTAQQNERNTSFFTPPPPPDPACYANCDGSTTEPVLTVDDFTCFINEFAAAQGLPLAQQIEHYANCDGSTTSPVLTVDDFTCFINAYAAGCP